MNNLKIIGAAFGVPQSETTFSGVSKHLFDALEQHNVMTGYVSTRQIRFHDVFTGAVDFSKTIKNKKPRISSHWLWQKSTVAKLSKRFYDCLTKFPDFNAVLQIGTHIRMNCNGVKHYCFTDMTVAQVASSLNASDFSAGKLRGSQIAEAVRLQKSIFDSCHHIFVNSNWTRDSIIKDYSIESDRVHAVGVGASLPPDLSVIQRKKEPNILFLGRNWQLKGGPLLIEAFRIVKKAIPAVRLTIIGCEPNVSEDNVRILGHLNKNAPADLRIFKEAMSGAAVLCVPSLFEAFGICFIEAQLYGVPPVTFSGEGRGDAIIDGITGILVKERTADALSQVLIKLLSDSEKTYQMGLAGRDFVLNNMNWNNVADRILRVIENGHVK